VYVQREVVAEEWEEGVAEEKETREAAEMEEVV